MDNQGADRQNFRPVPAARRSIKKTKETVKDPTSHKTGPEVMPGNKQSKPHDQKPTGVSTDRHSLDTEQITISPDKKSIVSKHRGAVAELASVFEGRCINETSVHMRSRKNTGDQRQFHHRGSQENRKASFYSGEVFKPSRPVSTKLGATRQATGSDIQTVSGSPNVAGKKVEQCTSIATKQFENISSRIDLTKSCEICDVAGETSVNAMYCKDCRQVICLNCLVIHDKCNSTKDHHIMSKHTLLSRKENTSSLDNTSDEYRFSLEKRSTEKDRQFCEMCDCEASVSCAQCDNYLCDRCMFFHHEDQLKQKHTITPLKARADNFLRKLRCRSHPNSRITFFCNYHREIICIQCKTEEKHYDCEDDIISIDGIYSVASGIDINKTLAKQKLKEMGCLLQELSRLESILTFHLKDLSSKRKTFLAKIGKLQDRITYFVESGLQRSKNKIIHMISNKEEMIKAMENDNRQILSIFEKQFEQFIGLLEKGSKEEIFMMQTTTESHMLQYEHLFEKLQEPLYETSIKDKPNIDELIQEIILTKNIIMRENIVREKLVFDDQHSVCIGDIDLSALNVSNIVGMDILPYGEIILCDKATNVLIIFSGNYTVMSTLKLSKKPYSMTLISKTRVFVSEPDDTCIEYATIDDKMKLTKGPTILTKLPCLLISRHGEELIALIADALCKCLATIDTNGNVTSAKPIYADTENILESVLSMVVCPVNEIIYIAEKTQGCVGISIADGVLVFNYKDTYYPNITGLSTHPTGNLFIAERDADKIVMIHITDDKLIQQNEKVKDVISVEGLRPSYLAYSSFHHALFVNTPDSLRVYKLI